MRNNILVLFLACVVWLPACGTERKPQPESVCYGTVSNGRLENGVMLPREGRNFTAYSSMGATMGRTYVHSKVERIVLTAYGAMELSMPGKVFVYGGTGRPSGGRIQPHRTHQNGQSVDFMVPILDASGRSVPLPTNVGNKFGYGIDFDKHARFAEYTIDFEALAEHLYQLSMAAKKNGAEIALVIFDPPYLPRLFSTRRGAYLKANIPFMKGRAWVRHDEHFHVDFAIKCRSLKG